jgi:hypothetical protein
MKAYFKFFDLTKTNQMKTLAAKKIFSIMLYHPIGQDELASPGKPRHQEIRDTRKTETPGKPRHQENRDTRKTETPGTPRHQENRDTRKTEKPGKPRHQENRDTRKTETPGKNSNIGTISKPIIASNSPSLP